MSFLSVCSKETVIRIRVSPLLVLSKYDGGGRRTAALIKNSKATCFSQCEVVIVLP